MITFKNIAGNKFLAVGTIQRKSALNGEKSLTGTLYDGKDVLNKIDKGWSLEFYGEPYVVTYFERNDNDNSVSFDAIHKFFWDMTKKVLYSSTEISGSHTIKWYLDQIFANTGYTYALNFSPAAIEKDNWGNKTRLSLFNDLITSIAGEFEINGTLISIFQNIGTDLSTIVRYGFNLSDMTLENDATSFVTYGEGFGAYANQENQTGDRVHVTYTSPLAGVYGILQAEPIDDQRYTSQANLQAAVKAQVDASFSVSVQLSLYDLTAAGYPYKMANVGDWLTAVDENLDFKQRIRIIGIDDEFSADGTRISYTVTAGDVGLTKKYQDANDSMASQVANAVASASQAATDANFALIAANGKLTACYVGSYDELPTTANEGDLGWVTSGDGRLLYIYTKKADGSYYWEKRIDPEMGDQIAAGVTEAVTQANAHTDEVKQGLSTDIATVKSQAASQAIAAEANAKSAATSQFMQAQDALAAAKTNLQNDIDKNKGNIVEINQTLTGFDGTLQRVQDAVNNLGQTNQLMNTEFTPDLQGWNDQMLAKTGVGTFNGSNILDLSGNSDFRQLFIPLNGATVVSASVYRKISISGGSGGRWSLMFYDANNGFISSVYGTYQTSLPDFTLEKLENVSVPSGAKSVSFRVYSDGTVSIHQIVQPMLVFESTVGTYVQGNYNNNDALAKVKLTADKATLDLSTYKQDADGRISKAQTDITATANQVATKVSQTDYDTKTGQLTTSVSKAQQTADAATTSLGNYKQDADGRISANSADIVTNANAIKQKVAQSDYDANNTKLTSRLTTVETTANGTATTVSDLKQAVNNLGQVNQLFNTEFTPDLQGWRSENANDYLNYLDYSGVYNMSHVLHYNGGKSTRIDIQSQIISISDSNQVFSLSILVKGSVGIAVSGFKSDGESGTGSSYVSLSPQSSSYGDWTLLKFNNRKITSGSSGTAKYISLTFTSTGSEFWVSQPMLVFSSTVGTYVQGNYNNNASLAQVKITADSISNFVRDSSGNISSDFQTALSKTSIITGSTLATSIQNQTATQITSALTDNNGKIISLINQDTSGVQIAGKNIVLDGNTTVTGDFYAKGGNFTNLNASNMTVGTLNGTQVNITNINANNIVSGAISGANLNINLNTGSVVFQKGRINSSDYTTDINIDQGYISTANGNTRAILKNGQLQLTSPDYYDLQTNPYLSISNDPRTFDSTGKLMYSAVISARDRVVIGNKDGIDSMLQDTFYLGQSSFYGLSSGKTIGSKIPTVVGGGATGVVLVGGSTYTNTIGGKDSPSIIVGWSSGSSTYSGNRIRIDADYFHVGAVYNRTSSASSNVVVAADGAIVRSSSARKYKLDIKNDISIADSLKLIEVPLSTWVDKHEHEENGSNERYFGMIAEDLRDSGLEYLVQYGEDNEVEGINYDRVALLLIPLVKELKERIEELERKVA